MVHMSKVLILGGTGWLSARIARQWCDHGAEVTALGRGGRPAPEGVELIVGDREDAHVYRRLQRDWDVVVDVSSRARHVDEAVRMLGPRAARCVYVSSVSVYIDSLELGADESAPTHAADDHGDYAAQKVAAEQAVSVLGDRVRIVRPGLITGPGDPSDRFGYWGAAFERAGTGAVLVPDATDRWVQVIDVDDLAAFIVRDQGRGVVDAVGDPHELGEVLEAFRLAAGHTGSVVTADDAWLEAHEVDYWMGERSLPLWLPSDMPGFARRSNAAFRAAGGGLRPLADTIARVQDDERTRGVDRSRLAGLAREDELALLAAIAA